MAGIFLPQPYTGFRAMRAGLLTTTYLEAMSVTQDKRSYKDTAADGTLRAQIEVTLQGPPCISPVPVLAEKPPLCTALVRLTQHPGQRH